MDIKKNKFIIIYIFSILILIIILISSIPFNNFLKKINLNDNQFVKDQVIINPNAKSSEVIDRKMIIKFNSEVDSSLQWNFVSLQDRIEIMMDKDEDIIEQHKKLFEALDKGDTPTGYSYN